MSVHAAQEAGVIKLRINITSNILSNASSSKPMQRLKIREEILLRRVDSLLQFINPVAVNNITHSSVKLKQLQDYNIL